MWNPHAIDASWSKNVCGPNRRSPSDWSHGVFSGGTAAEVWWVHFGSTVQLLWTDCQLRCVSDYWKVSGKLSKCTTYWELFWKEVHCFHLRLLALKFVSAKSHRTVFIIIKYFTPWDGHPDKFSIIVCLHAIHFKSIFVCTDAKFSHRIMYPIWQQWIIKFKKSINWF